MNHLHIELDYKWEPVFVNERNCYFFPNPVSSYMRQNYKEPAIYRWNIYRKRLEDEKLIYIGETELLCPRRIYHYLNPGPSQRTNIRLNATLKEYISQGLKVGLDVLHFDNFKVDEFIFTKENLEDKQTRKLLEDIMLAYYRAKGFKILNL